MSTGGLTTKTHVFLNGDWTVNADTDVQAAMLIGERSKLQSIKVQCNIATAMTIYFYDNGDSDLSINTDATPDVWTITLGKLVHKVYVGALKENLDFDMHGAILGKGLFCVVDSGGSGAADKRDVSVSAQYN